MTSQPNEGLAYLAALKGSENAAAAAPAPALAPELVAPTPEFPPAPAPVSAQEPGLESAPDLGPAVPMPVPQFPGAEKRRSPRYQCEGSVEMREKGCDVRTWATFTDISLHGCYVEAQATYPAGAVLDIKLETKGVRVETTGTVRVNYPYLGMGIAFTDMPDEQRSRLRLLLASISRPSVIIGPVAPSPAPAPAPSSAPHLSEEPLKTVPVIVCHPAAAIQALVEFLETRPMMMRDDFLRILRSSQSSKSAP